MRRRVWNGLPVVAANALFVGSASLDVENGRTALEHRENDQ